MPATSTTRTVASPHATATSPLGACPFAATIRFHDSFSPFLIRGNSEFRGDENEDDRHISPRSFCELNAQTRTTPSFPPHVTNDSLLPSAITAATSPSCAARRDALFFKNASAPNERSAAFQMLRAPPGRLSCLARLARYLASAILSCATVSAFFKSSRLNAPRCAPDCRLNRCTSPLATPTTAKLPHAETATALTGLLLSTIPSGPTRAGGTRTCSPRTPSFRRHVYARGSPTWQVTTFAQSRSRVSLHAMDATGGSFSSVSAIFRRLARRSTCDCDSSSDCWSWIAEKTRSARSSPPALRSRVPCSP